MKALPFISNRPDGVWVFEEEVIAGKSYRLLIPFGDSYRPLLRLGLSNDGSIICTPGRDGPIVERTARRRQPGLPLPPKIAADIGSGPAPKGFHISFHPSGVVNSPGSARTYRASLDSPGPHQLCRIQFEHPSRYPAVNKRRRDILLVGAFRLTTALEGKLTLIPNGTAVFYGDVPEQAVFILNVQRRDAMAFRLQFSVFATHGAWPKETTVEWISQDPQVHGFAG